MVLLALLRAGAVLAGDQATITALVPNPDVAHIHPLSRAADDMMATPGFFTAPLDIAPLGAPNPVFSSTEFRPRKHTVMDSDPSVLALREAPILRGTTVWQRMSDYRSHDRLQVLTLWESRGSSVSLQAGKRGDPSLQWTSRLMNRGGSTRGLLDQWFSVSLAGAGNTFRNVTHSTGAPAAQKQASAAPAVAGLK
jgi:hypothetical protein